MEIFLPVFSCDINETAASRFGVTIAPPAANKIINPYTDNSFLKKGKAISEIPEMNNPKTICFLADKIFSP